MVPFYINFIIEEDNNKIFVLYIIGFIVKGKQKRKKKNYNCQKKHHDLSSTTVCTPKYEAPFCDAVVEGIATSLALVYFLTLFTKSFFWRYTARRQG